MESKTSLGGVVMIFEQTERAEADKIARSSSLRLPEIRISRAAESCIQILSDFGDKFQDIKEVENGF